MRPPLWITVEGHGADITARLARCPNCGKVKVASDPCSFDHLAAILEWRAAIDPPPPNWRQIAADLAWAQTGEPHSPAEQEALDAYDQATALEPAGEDGNP